jgi:predicted AlkP superfamily phosphohydrolase/phosphomutase
MLKTFVLGLDGCSWELLEPWMRAGELPALFQLRDEAAWGWMESCLPPVTSPNWKCYSTGTNPGKLGVFWWENVDFRSGRLILPTADSYDGEELWENLSRASLKVAVINVPTTYPPKKVHGCLVSGGPDALDEGYTYPAHLEFELRRRFSYRVHPREVGVIDVDPERAAEQIIPLLRQRFQVAVHLLEESQPDFLHLTIYYINVLQHHLWDHPLVLEAWKVIDDGIATLRSKLKDWRLIVMVDHGTNKVHTQFNICTWMEKEGYLVLKRSVGRSALRRLGVSKERVAGAATALHLKDLIKSHVGGEARAFLPSASGVVGHAGRAGLIDWAKSRVVPSGQGPIYVNPDISEVEREQLITDLQHRLLELRDDEGRPIAHAIPRREEIYGGPHLARAPQIVVDQAPGVHISASVGSEQVFLTPSKWLAENYKRGLFLAAGADVRPQRLSSDVSILDIAPTVLHCYGLPIPAAMDGRILTELFCSDSDVRTRSSQISAQEAKPPLPQDPFDEREKREIEERLRRLGYL